MNEDTELKFNIPWDTEKNCRVKGEKAPTRLETNYDEEFDGALFDGMCPDLDPNIPKLKDNFIDYCPVDLPNVPVALLKLKKFDAIPFAGVPDAEIPKTLLSRLLPCCLKGRTTGFDIDIEQDLTKNGDPVMIDPDTALLPISIQFGDRGILKLGIDVRTESCFCDESCGPDDFFRIKFRYGVRYVPEEQVTPEDTLTSVVIEEKDVNKLFVSNRMVGMIGQIVDCTPENTISTEARDGYASFGQTEFRNCKVEEGLCTHEKIDSSDVNRWKYKVRLLNYDPCAVTPASILGDNRDLSDKQPSLIYTAYNLNEWSASTTKLPTGFRGKAAWHTTYDNIINKKDSKAKTRTLPCPIGAIVYVIDPAALDCCNECEEGSTNKPILLFYHQNRDVPEKPIMFLGNIDNPSNSTINVHSTVNVIPTTESSTKIQAKIAPQYYDDFAAEPLNTGVFCFMDTNGDYWAIPSQKSDRANEMFAIYEGKDNFVPVDDDGALIDHDADKRVSAKKAPYIPKIAIGGLYWLRKINNNWIVMGGTCPPEEDEDEEVGEVPLYTTITILMSLPDGDPSKATPESGYIDIGPHPLHAEMGTCSWLK